MDIKDLNKTQLILLAVLLSFITSIVTGITTVTLMEEAPESVTIPVNNIIRETVERIVPEEKDSKEKQITKEQEKLLEDLKYIKPLTVSLYKKQGDNNKLLGTGLLMGEDKVIIAYSIEEKKEGDIYFIKSIFGDKDISKIIIEKDFTIIELSTKDITEENKEENTNDDVLGEEDTL